MKKWLKRTLKKRLSHPTLITVFLSKKALVHNLRFFQSLAPKGQVAPVLKSNAYGHGLIPIAEIVSKEDVPFIIVDSYFEAKNVRSEGIDTPLLVIGYTLTEDMVNNSLKDVSFTITSLDALKELEKKARKNISLHVKIDTGMHRQGVMPEEKEAVLESFRNNKHLMLQGICSHLAEAGNENRAFTETQLKTWNGLVKYFKETFPSLRYWHISNTDGHFHKDIEANVTRLGIGLFGIHGPETLIPVMRVETIVTSLRTIEKGEGVGYDRTFVAEKTIKVATIPFGYYEGFDRRLSNKGFVKIGNTECPIIGRVSMNITSIDVSAIDQIKIGDRVTVISDVRKDSNSFEKTAEICGTISYEMVVRISPMLRRVIGE